MNIGPVGSGPPVTRLQGSTAVNETYGSQDADQATGDTVEISDAANYLGEIHRLPDIRQNKVDAAQAAIANGTLDTPENLDTAVGRFIDENA